MSLGLLTFRRLRYFNVRRCQEGFKQELNEWSDAEWAMALVGEVGELLNLLKKRRRGDVVDPKAIRDEFADVQSYLDLFAASEGINLEQALVEKFNEVSDRISSDLKL